MDHIIDFVFHWSAFISITYIDGVGKMLKRNLLIDLNLLQSFLFWVYVIFSVSETEDFSDYFDNLTISDDYVNHPDVVHHPTFPILACRVLEFQDSIGLAIARQGYSPQQESLGVLASALQGRQCSVRHCKILTFYFVL